ncbi:hypothetical protein BS78_K316800 [Paspalum vaginatum]|uniref:Uncharacterized protein n=1 Tax=Paspalum vaginatum TaxID=158149 RepID=A0A9W8CDL1_9POAL|nr:hypothetical protein BS78_K316800 [Paspalum vaginatum]
MGAAPRGRRGLVQLSRVAGGPVTRVTRLLRVRWAGHCSPAGDSGPATGGLALLLRGRRCLATLSTQPPQPGVAPRGGRRPYDAWLLRSRCGRTLLPHGRRRRHDTQARSSSAVAAAGRGSLRVGAAPRRPSGAAPRGRRGLSRLICGRRGLVRLPR